MTLWKEGRRECGCGTKEMGKNIGFDGMTRVKRLVEIGVLCRSEC